MMAPTVTFTILRSILRPSRTLSPALLPPFPRLPRTCQPAARRFAHAIPKPPSQTKSTPSSSSSSSDTPASAEGKPRKLLEPHYELTFTCVPCSGRSTHAVSKQGYHKGSVLITCPSCRNRHIISDNLNIFGNKKITIEDLMREKGQLVKRGTLGEDGDIEFWEDGTTTKRDTGSKAGITTGTSKDTHEESDALTEEEEAMRMRDTRNPSSQSTDPAPSVGSVSPGGIGTRPTVDSSASSHTVPSTRRQYSTGSLGEPGKKYSMARLAKMARDRWRPGQANPPEPLAFKKVSGDDVPFTKTESRRLKKGWRIRPDRAGLHLSRYEGQRRSLTRLPREEWQKHLGVMHRKSIVTPNTDGTEFTVFSKIPWEHFATRAIVDSKTDRRDSDGENPEPYTAEGEPATTAVKVRAVPSEPRFNGVRFTGLDPAKGKPQWIRLGPGRFFKRHRPEGGPPQKSEITTSAFAGALPPWKVPEERSRASSDLWGNKNVTNKMRDMIDQFIDKKEHSL